MFCICKSVLISSNVIHLTCLKFFFSNNPCLILIQINCHSMTSNSNDDSRRPLYEVIHKQIELTAHLLNLGQIGGCSGAIYYSIICFYDSLNLCMSYFQCTSNAQLDWSIGHVDYCIFTVIKM